MPLRSLLSLNRAEKEQLFEAAFPDQAVPILMAGGHDYIAMTNTNQFTLKITPSGLTWAFRVDHRNDEYAAPFNLPRLMRLLATFNIDWVDAA